LLTITFSGNVFTGAGQGKHFVELPWVKRQLIEKTGFSPFPGTLNIRLNPESIKQRRILEQHQEIEVKPEEGYLPGWLYRAKIFDLDCYVVVPEVPSYPKDVLEIIAPENIRKKYKINDGEAVTVFVTV
jgi:riboflavin kinase